MSPKLHLHLKKGALHEEENVPEGKPIPGYKLAEALHSKNEHVRKMAQFAKNAKKWHHPKKKK
jgi:hypothetical protein